MMIKKYWRTRTRAASLPSEVQRLKCKALVAPGGGCRWVDPVLFTVDTGADTPTIPRPILVRLGLGDLPTIDRVQTTLADGSLVESDVILLNFRLLTDNGIGRDVLADVETLIVEDGDEPLLGLSILDFYDYAVVGGRLVILGPKEDVWDELEDVFPERQPRVDLRAITMRLKSANPPSNVVPPMKPEKPPAPLEPPASTPQRRGAFLPPKQPIKPKKPK